MVIILVNLIIGSCHSGGEFIIIESIILFIVCCRLSVCIQIFAIVDVFLDFATEIVRHSTVERD